MALIEYPDCGEPVSAKEKMPARWEHSREGGGLQRRGWWEGRLSHHKKRVRHYGLFSLKQHGFRLS